MSYVTVINLDNNHKYETLEYKQLFHIYLFKTKRLDGQDITNQKSLNGR